MTAAMVATAAHAQDSSRWFVRAGPAMIALDEDAKMYAGGALVPGANVTINPHYTLEAELGYFVTRNVAVALTAGLPPMARIHAAGTIAPVGLLGKSVYGPSTLNVQYHFNRDGRFQPYVGAGAAFLIIFKTKDAALTSLKATNDLGEALQIGADYMVSEKTGVYFDAQQTFLKTTATGFLGPTPVVGKVRLNPAAFSVGVIHHF